MMRFAGPPETFRPISLKRLIDPEEWRTQFADTGFFRDKFVVIGPGSAILNDDHRTPFNTRGSKMIGSEVRLNEINAALHGELLVESSRTANRGVILVAGLASLALSLGFRDSRVKLGLAICVSAGFVAAAMALANQGNYMLSVLFTPLALFNGGILLDRFLPGRITSAAAATIPPTRRPES